MAADVFESYALTIVAAMILGGQMFGLKGVVFPLLARSGGILTSILGTFFVKARNDLEDPFKPLVRGFVVAALSAVAIFMALSIYLLGEPKAGFASVIGIVSMLILLLITKYYTGPDAKTGCLPLPVPQKTGSGTTIISGLSIGMESTFFSVLVVAATIFSGYLLLGFYGIALAGMGMLATTGIIMSLDTFGPISDNAQGMVEMAGLKGSAPLITGNLDAVGNTTKALTKVLLWGLRLLPPVRFLRRILESPGSRPSTWRTLKSLSVFCWGGPSLYFFIKINRISRTGRIRGR